MDYEEEGPRHYFVKIAARAEADIKNIYAFIVKNSELEYVAARQVDLIEKEILALGIFPNGYPRYEDGSRYRVRHFKKYCIFFEVDEVSQVVYVVRIFHARQDIKT